MLTSTITNFPPELAISERLNPLEMGQSRAIWIEAKHESAFFWNPSPEVKNGYKCKSYCVRGKPYISRKTEYSSFEDDALHLMGSKALLKLGET